MRIDLLYIDDCPSWRQGLENLKAALEAEGLEAVIRLARVPNDAAAACLKFLGSPSFCISGKDMWPEKRKHYNLNCRIYPTPQGLKGFPTVQMLRTQLRALTVHRV
jgi:hypothetical protein